MRHTASFSSPQVSAAWPPSLGLRTMPPLDLAAEEQGSSGPVAIGRTYRPFVIGVCGGTASGKTTVCDMIVRCFEGEIAQVPSDAFYKALGPEEKALAHQNEYDFDDPSAIDFADCVELVKQLRQWKHGILPQYDFTQHARLPSTTPVKAAEIILVEGILIFSDAKLRDLCDLKVFVECDADIRLARRVRRDISERGRALAGVLEQYRKFVKPSYHNYVEPSKRYADVIIPNIGEQVNTVAVDLLCQHIKGQVQARRRPQAAGPVLDRDGARGKPSRSGTADLSQFGTEASQVGVLVNHNVIVAGSPRIAAGSPRTQDGAGMDTTDADGRFPCSSDRSASPTGSGQTPEVDASGGSE